MTRAELVHGWPTNHNDNYNVCIFFPETIRCVISSPSECGNTWLLKKIIIKRINFDKLYIIGSIGDQTEDLESINEKTDFEFNKDI